jgi:hypothetical protein
MALAGALAAGIATLTPYPEDSERVDVIPPTCIVCGEMGGTDVVANLLLLAPFATGLVLLGARTGQVTMVAGLATLAIETAQIAWIPGRDASLSDLLTNTTGATITAFLVWHRAWLLAPAPALARRLVVAGLAAWCGLEVLGAWALHPSLPPTHYWAQWAATLPHLDRFTGRVLGAQLDGVFLPPGSLSAAAEMRNRLAHDEVRLTASVVTGRVPVELAPIVSIHDERRREMLLLGQRGDQAVFRVRTRVNDLRFRPTAIGIAGAIPSQPGDTLHLTASYARGRYSLEVEGRSGTRSQTLRASPNWMWSFFVPFEHYGIGLEVYVFTALWLGGLLAPVGYWAGKSGTGRVALPVAAAVALTLALVPIQFGLPPLHLTEWLAAGVGAGGPYLLARHTATSAGPALPSSPPAGP